MIKKILQSKEIKNIISLFIFLILTTCISKSFFDYHKNIEEYKNSMNVNDSISGEEENDAFNMDNDYQNDNYAELRKYFLDTEMRKLEDILHIKLTEFSLTDKKIDDLIEISSIIDRFENDEILDLNDLKITKKLYEKMQNLIFFGDSQVSFMQGKVAQKYFYGIKCADLTYEYEKIDECLTENLTRVVLFNGYNIGSYKNTKDFIDDYYKIINKIHNFNPNIKIYITSLLPPTEEAILKDIKNGSISKLQNGALFNDALKKEFSENKTAKYIDTSFLVKKSYYQPDGIHFEAPFYKCYIPYVVYYVDFID